MEESEKLDSAPFFDTILSSAHSIHTGNINLGGDFQSFA